jgi:hypothetical protein
MADQREPVFGVGACGYVYLGPQLVRIVILENDERVARRVLPYPVSELGRKK